MFRLGIEHEPPLVRTSAATPKRGAVELHVNRASRLGVTHLNAQLGVVERCPLSGDRKIVADGRMGQYGLAVGGDGDRQHLCLLDPLNQIALKDPHGVDDEKFIQTGEPIWWNRGSGFDGKMLNVTVPCPTTGGHSERG